MSITRRHFVKIAGAAVAAPLIVPSSVLGRAGRVAPANKVGLGFIGTGKRAFELFDGFLKRDDVRVMSICDVDTTRREAAKKRVDEQYKDTGSAAFIDYRELLAMKGLDAVVIATPDHWHANQVADACRAKKDIYCEKPLTLNLAEGKAMIEAARKHKIVFQVGSQQRTEFGHKFVTACEYVRSGRLGTLVSVNVGVGVSSKACDLPEESMEPGLDWDRWLGPAPMRAYNSILSPRGVHKHYPNWRLYREYSGGMMTDFGAHNFDIAQWGLGMDDSGPVSVTPPADERAEYGARLMYANGVEMLHGGLDGITFTGTKGIIHVFRDRLVSIPDDILKKPLDEKDVHLPHHASQIDNWMDCIRSRERPLCDVEVGARSIACAHLCNLAYWHRKALKWDPKNWNFGDDKAANAWLDYERRKGYELSPA